MRSGKCLPLGEGGAAQASTPNPAPLHLEVLHLEERAQSDPSPSHVHGDPLSSGRSHPAAGAQGPSETAQAFPGCGFHVCAPGQPIPRDAPGGQRAGALRPETPW